MATYTPAQIAQYAYNAGFRGTALAQAVSVAMAESGGVSNAVSSDGYDSHGLWQFIPATWQSITGTPFINADNPQANANAAFKLWNQNDKSFSGQWSTWDNGAAKANLPAATAAAATIDPSGVANATETASLNLNPADGFGVPGVVAGAATSAASSALGAIFKPFIEYAIEAGLVIGGMVLLLLGGMMTVKAAG